jgi:hypothetical protein
MFTNTDPTGEDQMIYMAGARIGMFEVAMLLTSVNMSALDRALPFRPYVPPSSTPDNNQPPVGAQVPANAAMVGGIVGGLVLIASGVVVALFMRRKRFPNSTATNFSNEAENFNNEITLVPINNDRTKEITSATAQISSIPVYGETTVVPTFMGKYYAGR